MIEYLKIGQIVNTHGVKGEVKVYPLTDNVRRFSKLSFVFMLGKDGQYEKVEIEGVKYFKEMPLLKLKNVDDMDAAMKFRNQYLYVDRENAVKLPKDTYFITDLIGLDVITEDGNRLGELINVFSTGSNDVYEVKREEGKNVLLPAIGDVILEVNIEEGFIKVRLMEGLL